MSGETNSSVADNAESSSDEANEGAVGVPVSREEAQEDVTTLPTKTIPNYSFNRPQSQSQSLTKSQFSNSNDDNAEVRIGRDGKVLKFRANGRIKTRKRSKQKNIRKDNRPEEMRPTGFNTRVLTSETRKHMGLD